MTANVSAVTLLSFHAFLCAGLVLDEDDIENHNLLSTVPPSFVESRL